MQCEIVVREATPRDLPARAELVRSSITEYDLSAFLFFFFQELTLQVCVLCGAVLFIFVGASLRTCALVVPGAAAAVALGVALAHRARAERHVARVRREARGWVAESGGALVGSLSAAEGGARRGVLQALCVARARRRRGAGAALVAASARWARREGLESLEAVTSELQAGARALLHAAGWELRGSYERPVLGAALTLPMTQLGIDLPHA